MKTPNVSKIHFPKIQHVSATKAGLAMDIPARTLMNAPLKRPTNVTNLRNVLMSTDLLNVNVKKDGMAMDMNAHLQSYLICSSNADNNGCHENANCLPHPDGILVNTLSSGWPLP